MRKIIYDDIVYVLLQSTFKSGRKIFLKSQVDEVYTFSPASSHQLIDDDTQNCWSCSSPCKCVSWSVSD